MNILLCELNKKEKKLRRYFLYLEPLKICVKNIARLHKFLHVMTIWDMRKSL